MHQKEVNFHDKVNERIPLLIIKHNKDILTLVDEITSLDFVIQSLAVPLVNEEYKVENTIDITD